METTHALIFPAIRGVQAGREYYVSMCPLRLIPRIFIFDDQELRPEIRAQRTLNKGRIPEMVRYILENPKGYTFSAITASIDSEATFSPFGPSKDEHRVGILSVPMDARFIINDGQHRRAAIEEALRQKPELANESIAVVFFLDVGLARCQQMFADLNRYAIRPSRSLGVLYDHRDQKAQLAKLLVIGSDVFKNVVEMERSTLSLRSRKLFTLSALYHATVDLLDGNSKGSLEDDAELAKEFWETVAKQFKEWQLVREGKMLASEVRQDFIHSHGIALQALARAGNVLLRNGTGWKAQLKHLKEIDWSRNNAKLWEGRAMTGGKVSKVTSNVILTTNAIKIHLNLPLTPEEQEIENNYKKRNRT